MEVAVIIPAAGQGTRLGGHRKQFRLLGSRSVLVQTILVFERHPLVDHIIVATPGEAVAPLDEELRSVGITKLRRVIPGGTSRQESVRAALFTVPESVDVVLIHDAVRPFVRMSSVAGVIDAVRQHGAASLAIPASDTLRRVTDGCFAETIDRNGVYRVQTPQGFRRDWVMKAHARAVDEGMEGTDDVGLVQWAGHPVHLVEGDADNVKITTPSDWDRARNFWPVWERVMNEEKTE
jgi:2-C-methyl-D-erythritol 4-phosphate cytidylyltransferase